MQPLNAILAISGTFGVVAGTGLLLMPERVLSEPGWLRRWLFERNIAALLNRYEKTERLLYRHHRPLGAFVIVGALTLLALLWRLLGHSFMAIWAHGLGVRMAIFACWALIIFSLLIGIYLFIRPSALKGFEATANRWIEPFPSAKIITVPAERGISRLILRAPRFTGLLLLAAGIACLLALAARN